VGDAHGLPGLVRQGRRGHTALRPAEDETFSAFLDRINDV
jgi:hypothetical protein